MPAFGGLILRYREAANSHSDVGKAAAAARRGGHAAALRNEFLANQRFMHAFNRAHQVLARS